ncbi:DUF5336 domain-containing protein [Saccharomonospora sp. NPDC006951]
MTEPGNHPYPAQPYPPAPVRPGLSAPQWLHLATFALGLVAISIGFAPSVTYDYGDGTSESASFYEGGAGLTPALYLVAGLVALLTVLRGGDAKPGPLVPALAAGVTIEMMFSLLSVSDGYEAGAGLIIMLVVGVAQVVFAFIGYALDSRELKYHRPVG